MNERAAKKKSCCSSISFSLLLCARLADEKLAGRKPSTDFAIGYSLDNVTGASLFRFTSP